MHDPATAPFQRSQNAGTDPPVFTTSPKFAAQNNTEMESLKILNTFNINSLRF
jgi:hypothetical protein